MSQQLDPCLIESAAALLRPFAVRAMRSQVRLMGMGALDDDDTSVIEAVIEEAGSRAMAGALVAHAPMTPRDFERASTAAYVDGLGGLGAIGDIDGLFKKIKNAVKKVTKKVTKVAKKVAKKVVDVHKKVFKKLIVPVIAPTIARKLKQRDQLNRQAEDARQRWEASGQTDQAAYAEWQDKSGRANKRMKIVQKQLRTAAAIVAAVVAAPYVKAAVSSSGAATQVADAIKDKAIDAAADKAIEAAVPGSHEAASEEYAASSEEMNAPDDADQGDAAQPETKPSGKSAWWAALPVAALLFS